VEKISAVYHYNDYKKYLLEVEAKRAGIERGFRSRIAEALGCQNAYVSQIFNSEAHFSLEQAHNLSHFLNHSQEETKFFLLLVDYARAGTQGLKKFFLSEIEMLRQSHLNLKSRVGETAELSQETKNIYYSSPLYPTIHMLITIPEYRTIEKISKVLSTSEDTIRKVVIFLISVGLVQERKGVLTPGKTSIHLDRNSPHINQHHTQWRIAAINSLQFASKEDVHYSTVSSLSENDYHLLRAQLVDLIESYSSTVSASKEEMVVNFNIDFYNLLPNLR
jgi:uncharacterized protein (TIGR02147 family)